jgi:GldM N-terminal domain
VKSIYFLICFFSVLLFWSCNSKTPEVNISVYRALALSLRQSNYEIEYQVMTLQKAIAKDTSNPLTSYHAKKWLPKALLIKETSNEIFHYLDSQKINLKTEAGIKLIDNVEYWEENDFKAVTNLFQKKEKGEELKKRILDYEMRVLAIDPGIDSIFKKTINKIILLTDRHQNNTKTFTDTFFGNIPSIAAFAVLHKFENDIRNLEIQLMTYCYAQIPR